MLKSSAGGKRAEKEEVGVGKVEATPVITLTKAVDSVIKVTSPAADEAAATKVGPNASSSVYALRLPCKGWRGLGMRGGYKSPRYRHANYIQVIRQQHKSNRTPKMKRGFPPCRYHSQTTSIQIVLYTNKENKTSMISQCVRLCCVVQHLILKEVEVKSSSLWPFEDVHKSPVLYHRGLRHSDLRSIYMFFAQMWASKHRLSAAHEVRCWMYVGILQDLELSCRNATADSAQLSQVITDPLIRLDKLVSQTQTPEGYIFNKGSLSVLEVFIAGIYNHYMSVLEAKGWKQISSRIPAVSKVKNLVFSHASVHRWLQQKKKITCILHPDEWSSKVVLKWLQMRSIEYESHVMTKEEWLEKPVKDCVVLPALQVPGNTSPSICGLYAIALWLASRHSAQGVSPSDTIWEDLGRLEELYNAYVNCADNRPQERISLTCPTKTRSSDSNSWLVEAAGAVSWEELQQRHIECVSSPLKEQLTLLHRLANHDFRLTEHNSLAQESVLVCATEEAKRYGLVSAIEAMCRTVPISCQIGGSPDTVKDFESETLLAVTIRDVTYHGLIPTILIIAELSDLIPYFASDRRRSESLLHTLELSMRKLSLGKEDGVQTIAPSLEKAATFHRRSTKYLFEERPTYIDFVLAHLHKCCLKSADTTTTPWPTLTYIGNLQELM